MKNGDIYEHLSSFKMALNDSSSKKASGTDIRILNIALRGQGGPEVILMDHQNRFYDIF
jgi:hypothetical protein